MFKSKKRRHIFVEYLSDILQNKKIFHIASCCIFKTEADFKPLLPFRTKRYLVDFQTEEDEISYCFLLYVLEN